MESYLPELPHPEAGDGWVRGRGGECAVVVRGYDRREADWNTGVDTRSVSAEVVEDEGFGGRGGFVPSRLGEVGDKKASEARN